MDNLTSSKTYKIKTPTSDKALYFTIVGVPDPVAFFINSKEMKSFQWISALMVSYSKAIRDGRPIKELIQDMKNVFDPNGSYFVEGGGGVQVNSLVHHLALIIEQHIKS